MPTTVENPNYWVRRITEDAATARTEEKANRPALVDLDNNRFFAGVLIAVGVVFAVVFGFKEFGNAYAATGTLVPAVSVYIIDMLMTAGVLFGGWRLGR